MSERKKIPSEYDLYYQGGQLYQGAWELLNRALYLAPSLEVFQHGRDERSKEVKRTLNPIEYATFLIDEERRIRGDD